MKIFSTLILITISLCAGLCCPEEDDYNYEYFEVLNDTIISIENDETVFQLNDTIFINTLIKNSQTTVDNETIILSDLLDLDADPILYNNLILYKETSFGTLAKIAVTNSNIIILDGLADNTYDELIEVKNMYNSVNFSSKFGIKLLETGTYYLGTPNLDYSERVNITGSSGYDRQINIQSKIIDSDENGAYKFIVE
ncbi:hypothetical protein [Algibacter sp. R77976]|uniref:hypothetical protein n=1 Tax=Algibacter sp. R77976 TaxID=3093873 RepID=UPI0037C76F78